MELLDIVLISIALSMDACVLTIANCATYKQTLTTKQEWAMPTAFAIFQGVMPLIGFFIGSVFSSILGMVAEYVSIIIFFILAVKIIIDIIKERNIEQPIQKEQVCKKAKFTLYVLLIQAIATSIDALAVGVTFINLKISVVVAVLIIAIITFALVTIALLFGKSLGKLFGKYAQWVGAIILLLLAIKSLISALI